MNHAVTVDARSALKVPLDMETIARCPDWRPSFAWPLSQQETLDLCGTVMRRLMESIRDIADPETARIAEAAAPRVLHFILPPVHAAGVIGAAAQKGLAIESERQEVRYLAGLMAFEEVSDTHFERLFSLPPTQRLPWLRRLARPRYWTPWHHLPGVLLAPQASAVNPSDLLADRVRYTGTRVGYLDGPAVLRMARARLGETAVDEDRVREAAEAMIASAPVPAGLDPGLEQRLRLYIAKNTTAACRRIAEDLAALKAAANLPMALWRGSGGNLAAGLIASEVLRRGGEVVGFDHVTGRGLERNIEYTVLLEMVFASRFVIATPETAARLERLDPGQLLHRRHTCDIVGGRGYPRVRALDLTRRARRAQGARRQVTYASPMFRGWGQTTPPTTADPVQLDWELRLVKTLQTMPVELTCRPHPEGHFQGRRHPLAAVSNVSDQLFEGLLAETDVFLFDWFRSSAFWTALCTNRPIVMIELGYSYLDHFFTEEIKETIQERVRFVRAHNDDRNRLVVDREELAEAILSAPDTVDASFFQEILIGESR